MLPELKPLTYICFIYPTIIAMTSIKTVCLTLAFGIAAHFCFAQSQPGLSISEIMHGDDFVGYLPENIHWSEDGKAIYFEWNPGKKPIRSLYKYSLDKKAISPVPIEEQRQMPAWDGDYNTAKTLKVYAKNGDIFLYDIKKDRSRQVTNTVANESHPVFSGDEKSIVYRSGNDLYRWDIADGSVRQLTHFVAKSEKKPKNPGAEEKWLEADEMKLFDVLQSRKEKKDARDSLDKALKPKPLREIPLDGQSVSNLTLSPDGKYVTFRLTKNPGKHSTKVPEYVTESGYVKTIDSRPNVGSPQPHYKMDIYDIPRDTFYTVDVRQIPGIYDKPAFLKEYCPVDSVFDPKYAQPRKVIIHGPFYNKKGDAAFVVVRALDNKDRWIMQFNPADGSLVLIDRQHDDAWIGGPGISGWNQNAGVTGWLGDDKTIYFQSEKTGYSHLYTYNFETREIRQLTQGKFEILSVELSRDKKYFYLLSNKKGPAIQHFYRLPVGGGEMEQITTKDGGHQVAVSPDQRYLAVRYSFSNKPWELYLMQNKPGAAMEKLTHSLTPQFKAYPWRKPEIVTFKASDGALVKARLYKPVDWKNGGPGVIFVHGAGYLQNVHEWWSEYFREYMFHNFLADHGYTVLDIDYRGSAGYGRDWRTAIYRHMGGKGAQRPGGRRPLSGGKPGCGCW